jgi:ABC-2 type transport system ATP-binding protein
MFRRSKEMATMTSRTEIKNQEHQEALLPAIEVENLERSFNGLQALNGISFAVQPGEIFGFLGPNGAGKTTTIRILTGQLQPSAGSAWVAGCNVVTERQELKPQIGVVFEYQNLYMRLSARDNLNFSASLYGVPRERVDELLKAVQLQDRAKESLKKYSNGMKQRLLIARALLHSPKVLFLDEPTRGLDPNMRRQIWEIVTELAQQGITIFLTTHYMEEADQLCDRVAILDRGKIVASDTPTRLKEIYQVSTLEDVFVLLAGHAFEEG